MNTVEKRYKITLKHKIMHKFLNLRHSFYTMIAKMKCESCDATEYDADFTLDVNYNYEVCDNCFNG